MHTLFSSQDSLLMQESNPVPAGFESLLGLSVPYLFLCKKGAGAEQGNCYRVTMRDFVGMEEVDAGTRKAGGRCKLEPWLYPGLTPA